MYCWGFFVYMNEFNKNQYAVLTASILYRKDITPRQKILVAMISNMSNEKGYCWASNKHFSECFDCEERTIQRDLQELEEKKILNRVINLNSDGSVKFRALIIIEAGVTQMSGGGDNLVRREGDTDVIYKNKVLKTNKKRVEFTPPTIEEVTTYFVEKGYSKHTAETAFNYYQNLEWKDSNNKQVVNWKSKMIAVWMKEENKIKSVEPFKITFPR